MKRSQTQKIFEDENSRVTYAFKSTEEFKNRIPDSIGSAGLF